MTREEAIKELKILKEDYWDDDGYGHETQQYDDTLLALDMAINALEQEPFMNKPCVANRVCHEDKVKVLDKIRAEIEKLQKMCDTNDLNLLSQHSAFGMALDVIDEYKAESEE